jgi:hypothetical protein
MKRPPALPIGGGVVVPRGRPKHAEPSSSVSVWLPAGAHDKLIRLANQQETSISALVRSLLLLKLR